ncbi:MAG: hypothetical protein AB1503_08915 [Bacillota bacterium]|nr:hypothetical protein [Bacillota bacterium]
MVLVSHSAKLAEGVKELVEQVTQGCVPVVAGGAVDGQRSCWGFWSPKKAFPSPTRCTRATGPTA